MTPCDASGWEQFIHATHPTMVCGYNLHFFTICFINIVFCPGPMLLVFAMICWIKMPCSLPHNHYCFLLPSPVCLPHLLIWPVHASSLHPLLAQHLCYVDVYCVLFLIIFLLLWYVTFLCDFILACFWYLFLLLFCIASHLRLPCLCQKKYEQQEKQGDKTFTKAIYQVRRIIYIKKYIIK